MFHFDEMPGSGAITTDPPSYTLKYKADGEDSDSYVWSFALSATPAIVSTPIGILYRQDIRIDPVGYAIKEVTVPYGPKKKATGEVTWSFDTTGATVKIKAAKEHVGSFDASGSYSPANKHKGAIGVKPDGDVEGADIVIPALKLTYQFKHPLAQVTEAFAKSLARATGTTNLNPFRSFAAGELLFLGGTGSDGTEAEAEVSYHFAASENTSSLTFGDIANIVKQGHHYAWVEFGNKVESGKKAVQPTVVHVERVYDAIDFASVFGWS